MAIDTLARYLGRHRFALLGYSAEDDVYCPACLRLAAGLSPHRPDSSGKPVIPLYLADPTVREEACCHCGHSLMELLPGLRPPTVMTVVRIRRDDSTIVRREPVGTVFLDQSGYGTLFVNALGERYVLVQEREDLASLEAKVVVAARPPAVRRHGAR